VNAIEDRETVEAFLKKTPLAYPAVLSSDDGIWQAYHVGAIPVFVLIGRDGRIAEQQVGFGGERDIRLMLEKVGLNTPAKSH
jgi:hypothetical protein